MITQEKILKKINKERNLGTRSKKSYMKNIRNMTDKDIETELQEIIKEKQSNQEAFGFQTEE